MKYEIISSYDVTDLEKEVNTRLKKGWKLQGGVSSVGSGSGIEVFQAMVNDGRGEVEDD